jgi:hypothetical protein
LADTETPTNGSEKRAQPVTRANVGLICNVGQKMTDADFDFELRRLFLVFGSGIALFLLFFLFRVLKVFFVGKRFRGVVARVRTFEHRGKQQCSYVVEYEDPSLGRRFAHERQEVPLQEFKIGDAVTIYVKDGEPPVCEILSWQRVLVSFFIIFLVILAMFIGWQHFFGPQMPNKASEPTSGLRPAVADLKR